MRTWRYLLGTFVVMATGCGESSSDNAPPAPPPGGGTPNDGWPSESSGDASAPPPPATRKPAVEKFSDLGIVPFDVDRKDLVGPDSHDAQYGKLPEIAAVPGAAFIDVAVRQTDESGGAKTVVVRLEPAASDKWQITRAYELRSLGHLLGFARSAEGHYFYATGSKDSGVTKTVPAPKEHRSNIVRVLRFDESGKTSFDIDVDVARAAADGKAEPIVSPGAASSARLSVAGNVVGLFHGIHTEPDGNGTRHQKAASTFLDKDTGAIRKTSSIWVSHSFDQRHLVDGSDLYEFHLGDAFPRATTITRVQNATAGKAHTIYRPKGATGNNNTFTRLGNVVRVDAGAGAGSFLGLVATERTTSGGERVSGSRDLGLIRLTQGLASGAADVVDTSFATAQTVQSGGEEVQNHVRYLTDYHTSAPGATHAERPKLVSIGGGEFIVLFEQWTLSGNQQTFKGTFAMRIDGEGAIASEAKLVSRHHLPRGDDAFTYRQSAAWVTGDEKTRALTVHIVKADLTMTEQVIP